MTSQPAVLIRPAQLSDLDFLVDGNAAMAAETEGLTLDTTLLAQGVTAVLEGRAPARYWVAEHDGAAVGQLLITYEWSDWRNRLVWWIQSVYVVPAARRRGIFSTLYRHVREVAMAEGAGGVRLYADNTNLRAHDTYRSLGMNGDHYRVFEDMF